MSTCTDGMICEEGVLLGPGSCMGLSGQCVIPNRQMQIDSWGGRIRDAVVVCGLSPSEERGPIGGRLERQMEAFR